VVAAMILIEATVRLSGVTDFPVYTVDDGIGYLPAPNQSGAFLRRNHWFFNDRSMPTDVPWNPKLGGANVLVIGNSIIMGGNPYDQKDKLGPLIQGDLGSHYQVWPVAAGGWTNVNESVYLERNRDVIDFANVFVWEYMQGGLSQLTKWNGQYVFPRDRPIWATWYVLRRYVLPRFIRLETSELPPQGVSNPDELKRFENSLARLSARSGGRGILFLYPRQTDYQAARVGQEWLPERSNIERLADKYRLRIMDLSKHPLWNERYYVDGVHPTVEGNVLLARILASEIESL
jgi:hypothetical protein